MGTGYNISTARAKAGMTQKELADALNVTQQTIYYYESGDRDIKGSTLVKMSKVLGCTVSYLLGLSDNEHELAFEVTPRALEPDEQKLVRLYRKCNQEWKHYVFQAARMAAFETKSGRNYMEPLEEEELKDA